MFPFGISEEEHNVPFRHIRGRTSHYNRSAKSPQLSLIDQTHTHIDSTSTNMKFSSVSFLAAVFSSPPSTPLFGGSNSVMVRIICSVCDDTAKMTWRRRDYMGDEWSATKLRNLLLKI
jgi:hypothetical protein